MSHEYNEYQIETVVIVHTAASLVSLIASSLVIINYFAIPSLRKQLAYKLTICIAISDFIFSLGNSMGAPTNDIICTIQSILIEFGSISSVLWVVAVSFTINHLMTTKEITGSQLKRMLYMMHMVIWSVSCTVTILPLFTGTYGPAGGWCWMKRDKLIDTVFRYALFYIPLWLSILYMIAIYIMTWRRVKKINAKNRDNTEDSNCSGLTVESQNEEKAETAEPVANTTANTTVDTERKKRSKALKRMVLFPLVLIAGFLFSTIRRITDSIAGSSPFWLTMLQVLGISLIGFFDALVYGFTKDIREKDLQFAKKYCVCCA